MKIKKRGNAIRVPPVKKAIRIKRTTSDFEEESTVSKAIQTVKRVFEEKNANLPKFISSPHVFKTKQPRSKPKTVRKKVKIVQRKRRPRGIVYLGHIPHGFYEEEMRDYFEQFGHISRVRIVRSPNTGKSCGYGYVEFKDPEVAKVAAETMHNYLMCGRLLKATYIPPEKQHKRYFAGDPWSKEVYPKLINRNKVTEERNRDIDKNQHKVFVQSAKDKLSTLENKLKMKGFDIKFTPVNTES